MVCVLGSCMQNLRVGDELYIADLEDHVQREALAGCFKYVRGFALRRGQWGYDAFRREALQGAHEVWVPPSALVSYRILDG